MNYKISVIMPIYNAEKTLVKAIDSVINQTIGFENIELILIDDNSTDNSKSIIKEYADKYSNIKDIYFNQNHGSPSFGRNMGIDCASSDYIMFIDNDDEYVEDLCEKLYSKIIDTNVDIVSCNTINLSDVRTFDKQTNIDEVETLFENDSILKYDNLVVWNKIFKKNIINENNIKFPNTRNEDYYFCAKYFINSNQLIHLNYYGYKWYDVKKSLSKGFTYNQTFNLILMYNELLNYFILNNKDYTLFFNRRIRGGLLVSICYPQILNSSKENVFKIFNEYCEFENKFEENKLNIILYFGKELILKKHYLCALFYLKLLFRLHKSPFLNKIFKKFN